MVYENQEELYLATPDSGLPCSLTFFHAKNCRHLEAPSLFLQPLLTNTKKFEKPQGKTEDVAHPMSPLFLRSSKFFFKGRVYVNIIFHDDITMFH